MISSPAPPPTAMPATAMGTGMAQVPGATPPQAPIPLGAVAAGTGDSRLPSGGSTLAGANRSPANTGTKTLLGQ